MYLVFKKDNFINKFFTCFILSMFIFMFFVGTNVFATDLDFYYNDSNQTLSLPSWISENNYNYLNYVYYTGSVYRYFLVVSRGNISIKLNNGSGVVYSDNGLRVYSGQCDTFNQIKSSIENRAENTEWNNSGNCGILMEQPFTSSSQFYCNVDVTDYNDDSNVVFQAPPQEQDKVLAPIVEGQEMKPLQEILLILPVVLIVIVGPIAIRKAIQFLMNLIRQM